jgi:hypothetical protein
MALEWEDVVTGVTGWPVAIMRTARVRAEGRGEADGQGGGVVVRQRRSGFLLTAWGLPCL